ncbi:PAB-dependent poly(A)-specific ribonuclease subunit pan3-like [Schizosaccharomyces pombe]
MLEKWMKGDNAPASSKPPSATAIDPQNSGFSTKLSINSPSFTPLKLSKTSISSASNKESVPLTRPKSYSSALSSGKNGAAAQQAANSPKTVSLMTSSSKAANALQTHKSSLARAASAVPFSPSKATTVSLKESASLTSLSNNKSVSNLNSISGASSPSGSLVNLHSLTRSASFVPQPSVPNSGQLSNADMSRHILARFPPFFHNLNEQQQKTTSFFLADDHLKWFTYLTQEFYQFANIPKLPSHVLSYHSLIPRRMIVTVLPVLRYATSIYKVIDGNNGLPYSFVQLRDFTLLNDRNITNVSPWTKVDSPHVIKIREAFTTHAFEQKSIVFVYNYLPSCPSLYDLFFASPVFRKRTSSFYFSQPLKATKEVLWCFASQLISALYSIHSSGLAAKMVSLKNVLMVGKMRLAIFGLGIMDVIQEESTEPLTSLQRNDCRDVGLILLALATDTENVTLSTAKAHLTRLKTIVSTDASLVELIEVLIFNEELRIQTLLPTMLSYMVNNYESVLLMEDVYETYLAEQVENDRLLRLLLKLEFLDDRPEYVDDPDWSASGVYFVIRLFRKYMFQVQTIDDASKKPTLQSTTTPPRKLLNKAHLLSCLNKLDAGTDEQILLEDEFTRIIMSFKEVKTTINTAFMELERRCSNNLSVKK